MTDWTLSEFLFELEQDLNRRVLFVEGLRDLAFWRGVVHSNDRRNTVIYPISSMVCEIAEGGERGRLLFIARAIFASHLSNRVLFFADADYDRLLGREHPSNVVLTDGRDLESYGLTPAVLAQLCTIGMGTNEATGPQVFDRIVEVTRPIGLLRIASTRVYLKLPFQRTFESRGGIRRFLQGKKLGARLDMSRLITTLIQNSELSLAKVVEIGELLSQEIVTQAQVAHDQIVHGKDFMRSLAFFLDLDVEQAERLLFLSLNFAVITSRSNIALVRKWITAA